MKEDRKFECDVCGQKLPKITKHGGALENFIDLPQGRNSALDFGVHAGEVKVRLEFLPRNRWSI